MRRNLEGPIHGAVLAYLRSQYPKAVIHHSPNETDVKGPMIARAIAKQKLMGMLVGFPDLMLLLDGRFYGFEVKAEGGRTSDAQKAVGEAIVAAGGFWAVVRSINDVKDKMDEWNAFGSRKKNGPGRCDLDPAQVKPLGRINGCTTGSAG